MPRVVVVPLEIEPDFEELELLPLLDEGLLDDPLLPPPPLPPPPPPLRLNNRREEILDMSGTYMTHRLLGKVKRASRQIYILIS